jgi:hypothetical protein
MTYVKHATNYTLKLPIGYRYIVYNGIKFIGIHELEAEAIKEAFILMASGAHSYESIKNMIYERHGLIFTRNVLRKAFENTFYTGYINDIKHIYEPLVTIKLFEETRKMHRLRGDKKHGRLTERVKDRFKYAGIFVCDECGSSCTPYWVKRRYIYYGCNRHKKKHKTKTFNQDLLDEELIHLFELCSVSFKPSQIKEINTFYRAMILNGSLGFKGISYQLNDKLLQKDIKSVFDGSYLTPAQTVGDQSELSAIEKLLTYPQSLEYICKTTNRELVDIQMELIDLQLKDKIEENESGLWQLKERN